MRVTVSNIPSLNSLSRHNWLIVHLTYSLYMAPEILRYEKYDAKADLWSVGAVLYEMSVGRPPFRAQNHMELLKKIEHARGRVNFPDEVAAREAAKEKANPSSPRTPTAAPKAAEREITVVPADVKALIRMLLKRKPIERASFEDFFSSDAVAEQLELVDGTMTEQSAANGNVTPVSSASSSSKRPSATRTDTSSSDTSSRRRDKAMREREKAEKEGPPLEGTPYDPKNYVPQPAFKFRRTEESLEFARQCVESFYHNPVTQQDRDWDYLTHFFLKGQLRDLRLRYLCESGSVVAPPISLHRETPSTTEWLLAAGAVMVTGYHLVPMSAVTETHSRPRNKRRNTSSLLILMPSSKTGWRMVCKPNSSKPR